SNFPSAQSVRSVLNSCGRDDARPFSPAQDRLIHTRTRVTSAGSPTTWSDRCPAPSVRHCSRRRRAPRLGGKGPTPRPHPRLGLPHFYVWGLRAVFGLSLSQ